MNPLKILGIDPSLTSLGLCYPDGSTRAHVPKKLIGMPRIAFHKEKLSAVLDQVQPHIIAIEDYTRQKNSKVTIQLAELGGVLRLLLWEKGYYRVAFINPMTLKGYIGAGKAKENVTEFISDQANRIFETDDESDAWAVAAMAYEAYGDPWIRTEEKQREFLQSVKWPAPPVLT